MKKLFLTFTFTILVTSFCLAGSSYQEGDTTFHNFNDGASGTSIQEYNMTFHNFDNGMSGTSIQEGNMTFHTFSDGTTGTSIQEGNMTLHDFKAPPKPFVLDFRDTSKDK